MLIKVGPINQLESNKGGGVTRKDDITILYSMKKVSFVQNVNKMQSFCRICLEKISFSYFKRIICLWFQHKVSNK